MMIVSSEELDYEMDPDHLERANEMDDDQRDCVSPVPEFINDLDLFEDGVVVDVMDRLENDQVPVDYEYE